MVNEREQVIIVDDDKDLTQLFTDAIKSSGLNAIGFEDPLHAVKHISEHHSEVCLVVTDWRMPNMNGLELAKKVAEIDSEIGVMLMSAYELDEQQLKEINKDDYVKKPIHMTTLIDTIKKEYFAKDCAETCEK